MAAKTPLPRTPVPVGPRLEAVLEIAYRARRPVLLEGPTGVGKSQVIQQVARKLGIEAEILDLSLLEPSDLVGLPVIADGRTIYARPRFLPSGGAGILLLEELNRAERYVQQPALQLLSARRLHDYVPPTAGPPWPPSTPRTAPPGDHRERLQEGFGDNSLGTGLIGLDPAKVFDLVASVAAKLIPRWVADPLLRHRAMGPGPGRGRLQTP